MMRGQGLRRKGRAGGGLRIVSIVTAPRESAPPRDRGDLSGVRFLPPISAPFAGAYALAQIGAYLSFMPLLQIILPLRAAAIDPAHKAALLSHLMISGAMTAGFANLLAGALSDRTRSRIGRRRPWMIAGLAGMMAAYGLIARAHSSAGLFAGLLAFQVTFNMFFAALGAIVADRVPDHQKGMVSALLSLGYPIGTVLGVGLFGSLATHAGWRLPALGLSVILLATPFILSLREDPIDPRPAPSSRRMLWPRITNDFGLAIIARLLTFTALNLIQTYLLYDLQERGTHGAWLPAGLSPEQAVARLIGLSTVVYVATALTCGRLSDLAARRKIFVIFGALGLSASVIGIALSPGWLVLMGAYLAYGGAMGCYHAIDNALMVQVLPSTADVGRDLGLVNLSNTLPQVLSPVLALICIRQGHQSYQQLFLIGAVLAMASAGFTGMIRGVR